MQWLQAPHFDGYSIKPVSSFNDLLKIHPFTSYLNLFREQPEYTEELHTERHLAASWMRPCTNIIHWTWELQLPHHSHSGYSIERWLLLLS